MRFRLSDNQGNVIVDPKEEVELTIPETKKTSQLIFGMGRLNFPGEGKYKFELIVDGQVHYETAFSVSQGKPEDFGLRP